MRDNLEPEFAAPLREALNREDARLEPRLDSRPREWYNISTSPATVEHEAAIFERLVVAPEAAQALLSIGFCPQDEQRMRELMDKNNQGVLSAEERAEMEAFRQVGAFLAIAQAKARLHLKRLDGGAPRAT